MAIAPGSYTFLFTDIEGSTRLWEQDSATMGAALREHDSLLRAIIQHHDGRVFKTIGDAFCAVFPSPIQAILAAGAIHEDLAKREAQPEICVRAAIHSGFAETRDDDFFGPTLNRVARLLAAGHGGQTLLSEAATALLRPQIPPGFALRDLGEHRLKDLVQLERIAQLDPIGAARDFPPLKTLSERPNNLPLQPSALVGRDVDLATCRNLAHQSRLVTLTGAGGCGKTRLCLQLGAEMLDQFSDGVWFVELATLDDSAQVPDAIAVAIPFRVDPATGLEGALRDRQILLLVDNCEHVVDAAARVLEPLLRRCPRLSVITTSREPLRLAGEQVFRLPSLLLPDPKASFNDICTSPAVQLFIERARQVQPAFVPDEQSAPHLAAICRRLDGLPLAIELAAARIRSLTPREIEARLDDAFRILTGGSRTALPRQQTIRGAIDWSYGMLGEIEAKLFRRLSTLPGPWGLPCAEATLADDQIESYEVLDLIEALVDRSLVSAEPHPGGTRYRLLETVRAYATEKMDEPSEPFNRRHFDWTLRLALDAMETGLDSIEGAHRSAEVYRESDHVRAALRWGMTQPSTIDETLQLAAAVHRTCLMRWPVSEVLGLWRQLLERSEGAPPSVNRLAALSHAAWYATCANEPNSAMRWVEEALPLADQVGGPLDRGRVLNALGSVHYSARRFREARGIFQDALEVVQPLGVARATLTIISNVVLCSIYLDDTAAAEEDIARMEALLATTHDPLDRPMLVHRRSLLELQRLNLDQAVSLQTEALRIARECHFGSLLPRIITGGYAWILHHQGRTDEAFDALQEARTLARNEDERESLLAANCELATLHAQHGELDQARAILASAWQPREAGTEAWRLSWALAILRQAEGKPKDAARALAAAGAALRSLNHPSRFDLHWLETTERRLSPTLTPGEWDQATEEGSRCTPGPEPLTLVPASPPPVASRGIY